MRIRSQERKLLRALEIQPLATAAQIAKQVGMKTHTVHYHWRRFLEAKVITLRPIIDVSLLGFLDIGVFFSLAVANKIEGEKLLSTIRAIKNVAWIGTLGGDYQYGLALYCQQMAEVRSALSKLEDEFGPIFFRKQIAPRLKVTHFPKKYLNPSTRQQTPAKEYTLGATNSKVVIDSTDALILSALSAAKHHSWRELARQLGMNFSTLERRIKLLVKSKVIVDFYHEINTDYLEMESFKILLQLRTTTESAIKKITTFAKAHPNVTYLIETLGAWDIEIGVEVAKTEEITRVISELLSTSSELILDLKPLLELKDLKLDYFPFEANKIANQQ